MTVQNLKIRTPIRFPVSVQGAGGISVSKTNGQWTVEPDFSALTAISGSDVSDPSGKQVWIYDPVSGVYNVLTLAGLGSALYTTTSTTSLAIEVASKVFTVDAGKDFTVGSFVLAASDADVSDYMLGQVTDYTDTSLTVNVTKTGGSGTHADWTIRLASPTGQAATIEVGTTTTLPAGSNATVSNSGSSESAVLDFGIPRGADASLKWLFETSTTMAAPATGGIRLNNATISSVTAIAINAQTADTGNPDQSDFIITWDDSTNTPKGHIQLREEGASAAIFEVTGVTDNTTWLQIAVTYVSGSLSLSVDDPLYLIPMLAGNKGADGDMTGPASSVDGEIALFNGTDGAALKRASTTGLLKASSGVLSAAVSGTDYQAADAQLFSNIPQNSKSAAYTTVLTDGQKCIWHPAADTSARTWTIDSNANVAYPIGTCLAFAGESSSGAITLSITSDTLVWLPTGSTGSRTLTAPFMAVAMKVTSTKWFLVGHGIS